MAKQGDTGISWTERTWNPIRGCSRVNEDCRNCYAERIAARFNQPGQPYFGLAKRTSNGPQWTGVVELVREHLLDPLAWREPWLVFVNSMSDLFHPALTFEQVDQVVAVMAVAKRQTFQVLTKRPGRMAGYLRDRLRAYKVLQAIAKMDLENPATGSDWWPLPNVWWGASMGHQAAVDVMMPELLACRPGASVLWVSAEPLLEVLDFTPPKHRGTNVNVHDWLQGIDWAVAGGETGGAGKIARPMPLRAAQAIRDACDGRTDMGRPWPLPFHFKQWGDWIPFQYVDKLTGWPMLKISCAADDKRERVIGDVNMHRVGKKAAGRLLDGRTWDEWPRGFTPGQNGE